LRETARREALFRYIFEQGPVYISNNYGTLTVREDGRFNWSGNMLLVPQVIPASALGSGVLDMRLFLGPGMEDRYAGAFTLFFDGIGGAKLPVDFIYSLDSQGFRIEHVPQTSLDGVTVVRRASSPLVIYFFRADGTNDPVPFKFPVPLPSSPPAYEVPNPAKDKSQGFLPESEDEESSEGEALY